MLKKNNRGFALVETLVTTVFIAFIFSMIFINFYPLIGEYEKRENYDDVTSKYGAYWIKLLVENSNYNLNINEQNGYNVITCNDLYPTSGNSFCTNVFTKLHVSQVVISRYNITTLKNNVNSNSASNINKELREYIKYLPKYDYVSSSEQLNDSSIYQPYRIIVKFDHNGVLGTHDSSDYSTFATMGVNK